MNLSRLTERLERMPMLRLLAPFAAWIALAAWYTLPPWFLAAAFVLTGMLAWFSSLVRKERSSSMIYVFRKKKL